MTSAETDASDLPNQHSGIQNSGISKKSGVSILPPPAAIALFLLIGASLFGIVSLAFPLFFPGPELLVTFPPDHIVAARERAFSIGRISNSGIALGMSTLVAAAIVPFVLGRSTRPRSFASILTVAVISTLITCFGTFLAFLLMEFTTQNMLGMGRTFMAHWLQFAAFGAGIGWAAGAAVDGRNGALQLAQRGAVTGFIAATVFDIVCAFIPHAQVDNLFPGGVIWGNRDPMALGLWITALMLCAIITVAGVRGYAKVEPR